MSLKALAQAVIARDKEWDSRRDSAAAECPTYLSRCGSVAGQFGPAGSAPGEGVSAPALRPEMSPLSSFSRQLHEVEPASSDGRRSVAAAGTATGIKGSGHPDQPAHALEELREWMQSHEDEVAEWGGVPELTRLVVPSEATIAGLLTGYRRHCWRAP